MHSCLLCSNLVNNDISHSSHVLVLNNLVFMRANCCTCTWTAISNGWRRFPMAWRYTQPGFEVVSESHCVSCSVYIWFRSLSCQGKKWSLFVFWVELNWFTQQFASSLLKVCNSSNLIWNISTECIWYVICRSLNLTLWSENERLFLIFLSLGLFAVKTGSYIVVVQLFFFSVFSVVQT